MSAFDDYRRQQTVLLTTRKRDGTTVGTPVNIALGPDGRAYFRTWSATGKAKRTRNFSQVWIAPRCAVSRLAILPMQSAVLS
jgi:uncharacterized protein